MRFSKFLSLVAPSLALCHAARTRQHVKDSLSQSNSLATRDDAGLIAITFVNNFPSTNMHVYIQSNDPVTGNVVLFRQDSTVFVPKPMSKTVAEKIPSEENCGISLGAQGTNTTIKLPKRLVNSRITVADGELSLSALKLDDGYSLSITDPHSNIHWGFLEANQAGNGIWVNPSYVDFAGMPLPFGVASEKGDAIQNVQGFPANGVPQVCDLLQKADTQDGPPWSSLCIRDKSGNLIRVASPMVAPKPEDFAHYWDRYIDQVWDMIGSRGISFNLQDGRSDNVNCTIINDKMSCGGVGDFSKPSSGDIWKCNGGPFRAGNDDYAHVASRFCAAFHRGTLLMPGGEVQPSLSKDNYFPPEQTYNKYAQIVHSVEADGMGYTFPTDDTKPLDGNKDVSGLVGVVDPSELTVFVGGLTPEQQNAWSSQATAAPPGPTPTLQPSESPSTNDHLPPLDPTDGQITSTYTVSSLTSVSSITTPSITTMSPSTPPAAQTPSGVAEPTGACSPGIQTVIMTGPVQASDPKEAPEITVWEIETVCTTATVQPPA